MKVRMLSGLIVAAMLTGFAVTNAAAEGKRAAPVYLAGLSSTDRTPQAVPANRPPPVAPVPPPVFDVVDPALVGTWETTVALRRGQSRWIWQITGDGTSK